MSECCLFVTVLRSLEQKITAELTPFLTAELTPNLTPNYVNYDQRTQFTTSHIRSVDQQTT